MKFLALSMGCGHMEVTLGGLRWDYAWRSVLNNSLLSLRRDTTGFKIKNILECYRLSFSCIIMLSVPLEQDVESSI